MKDRAASGPGTRTSLLVLIPIFNDWDAVNLLLPHLDRTCARAGLQPAVVLIDDGSTAPPRQPFPSATFETFQGVEMLVLRRNLGHQRAIAIGLAAIYERHRPDVVVIMDGDGEDAPDDVPRLIERLHSGDGPQMVFAERRRRSESWFFRVSYLLYRWTHRWLTGIPVRVGNFSALPGALVERLVVVSELWNHYAAAVFKARLPRTSIPTTRAARLGGAPKMNFVSLVAHGLSALSVHAEIIGVRLFVLTLAAVGVVILLLMVTISGYMLGRVTVPAWAGVGIGVLLLLLMQAIGLAMGFVFLVLHARSQPLFIPLRDYTYFLSRIDVLRPTPHA